ncbi:pyridoxamine 5'-phosphate oxidase family protein [Vallicoccus soli]|nr:pyridoxamine 5'-phosphate oxidase family protein [Vallicoccus soli]
MVGRAAGGELGSEESRALLLAAALARLVYVHRALPAVAPVVPVADGGCLVFAAPAGSEVATAAPGSVVALHADDLHGDGGWAVTATGLAELVAPEEEPELRRRAGEAWGPYDVLLRLPLEVVRGQRLG